MYKEMYSHLDIVASGFLQVKQHSPLNAITNLLQII